MSLETLFNTLASSLFLIPYSFIFIYLPGHLLIAHLKLTKLETIALSAISGFSIFSFTVFLTRSVNLPFYVAELVLVALVLIVRRTLPQTKSASFKFGLPIISFLLVAVTAALIQSSVLTRSAVLVNQGISFVNLSFHDSMQHIAIIKRLYTNAPILHPGFSGPTLINYHYLIDLSLAAMTRFDFTSLLDTYYRLYPLAVSLTFSFSIYAFTRRLTKSNLTALTALAFAIFSGNASFFAQFIRGNEFTWGANTFMINPLTDILQNPASIFVLSQLISVTHLLAIYTHQKLTKTQSLTLLLAIALIAGTMIGFKAWGGVLIAGGLGSAALWHFVKTKDRKLILTWIVSLAIAAMLFLPHFDKKTSASPVWIPGWSLKTMVNDQDRWNYLRDIFLQDHYISKNNLARLGLLYSKWFFIYLIGNYWIRLIGFMAIVSLVRKLQKLSTVEIIILTISVASFSLPLFFNQGRMAYDIEQFSPYALLFASIFTAQVLTTSAKLLNQKFRLKNTQLLILLLFFLSIPSNYTSAKDRLTGEKTLITHSQLETFNNITASTSPNDIIMLFPSHRNIATLEFAALTNRNTFYSGKTLSIITGQDYQTRDQLQKDFFSKDNPRQQRELIENNNITHLFLFDEDRQFFKPSPEIATTLINTQAGTLYQFNLNQ